MDKNKVAMIAVGSFIVGGLVVAASGQMGGRGHGWDNDRGYDKGMSRQNHGMMNDDNRTDNSKTGTDDASRGMGMMGDDSGMGMGGMHDMNMMVSSEREFLQEMIPHHEEAVVTAKEVVARGGSTPEIKKLAENIITAQEKEISDMKTWYKNWYGTDYVADGAYKSMMRPLTNLSGAALDKVFLSDMVMHHRGALMMAQSVSTHIEHAEMTTLVGNIKTTQSAEITEMENLLKTLR
jgi:uncharacterized protein (DUF305 family)